MACKVWSFIQNYLLISSPRFRWVYCQLENLRQSLAPSVRRILAELPESLDGTYERILHEIPKSNRVHAHRLLQCLTVAVRPLRVEELAEVLAVELDTTEGIPKLNENLRWEDQEQAVLSACSSLIAVVEDHLPQDDHSSRVVQFAHFSVKEFLTSDRLATSKIDASRYHHIGLEAAHTIMAQACLSVLLSLDSHIERARIKDFPLAPYAADNFGDHAEFGDVLSHIQDGVSSLLDADKPYFSALLWLRKRQFPKHPEPLDATPLYHVAEFGFRGMTDYLISRHPEDISSRGAYGMPLHAALYRGHADVAQLLLEHCVDVEIRGSDDRTPLHLAVNRGLADVARKLIDHHADIMTRDANKETPLHLSTGQTDAHFDAARLLLEHGADVHAQGVDHSTPLHNASFWGCVKIAQLFLEHGANVNARDKEGRTPLHQVMGGLRDTMSDAYFDIVRLLLARGADVDALDDNLDSPLHRSSSGGSVKATRILLEYGANVHLRNNNGETASQVASRRGHGEIVRLMPENLERMQKM